MKVSRTLLWILAVPVLLIAALGAWFYLRPVSFFNAQVDFQMEANGVHSRWITVDGYKVHYFVTGPENGPVAVLIHGLGGRAEDWRNLIPYLAYNGYRVYAPDLPGYGKSEQPANFSYSVSDEANIVVAFMDALNLRQVDLAGHSMGGWIVQLVAYRHPDRIRRLMIFDSVGLAVRPRWDTRLFTPTTSVQLDELEALLMPNPPIPPAFIARDILRISHKNAWVIQRAMASMLTGRDVTDAMLPQLKMPVLLVWGDKDRITPLSLGEKMHQLIPQSQLDVVPGCGHLAPVQCASRIGPVVKQFLLAK